MATMTVRDVIAATAKRETTRRMVARLAAGTVLGGAVAVGASITPAHAQDATPAGDDTCPVTTEEENIALVLELVGTFWAESDTGDGDMANYYTDETAHHWGAFDTTIGIESYLERRDGFYETFPDLHMEVTQAIADGDIVAYRYTMTGTHTGAPWLGIEPEGTPIEYSGMQFSRFECGKIVESWGEANHLSLYQQLGGIPEVTAPEE